MSHCLSMFQSLQTTFYRPTYILGWALLDRGCHWPIAYTEMLYRPHVTSRFASVPVHSYSSLCRALYSACIAIVNSALRPSVSVCPSVCHFWYCVKMTQASTATIRQSSLEDSHMTLFLRGSLSFTTNFQREHPGAEWEGVRKSTILTYIA